MPCLAISMSEMEFESFLNSKTTQKYMISNSTYRFCRSGMNTVKDTVYRRPKITRRGSNWRNPVFLKKLSMTSNFQ